MMHSQQWSLQRFWILVFIIATAGITQGLLLPVMTTLLEEKGYSSSMNGLSSSMLYLGILLTTFVSPQIVKRYGYKPTIIIGIIITIVSISLIPLFPNIWMWSALRFFVGMGDSLLHYTTQLWITSTTPKAERGKRISQYGLAYGFGFGLGPLGLNLLPWGIAVPIYVLMTILVLSLIISFRLDQHHSFKEQGEKHKEKGKIKKVYQIGFVALLPAFIYGIIETSIASGFPVYGLREGMSKGSIAMLITVFAWSSLLFQVPLGILGDRIGRRKVLLLVCTIGTGGMILIPWFSSQLYLLYALFIIIGGMLGSLFSMGLAFLIDILPHRYLPTANAIAAIHFSLGSIVGPYGSGLAIQYISAGSLFYMVATFLSIFLLLLITYRTPQHQEENYLLSQK